MIHVFVRKSEIFQVKPVESFSVTCPTSLCMAMSVDLTRIRVFLIGNSESCLFSETQKTRVCFRMFVRAHVCVCVCVCVCV